MSIKELGQRVGWFILFLTFGMLIFVVFSHMRPLLHENIDLAGRIVLSGGLLTLALLARRSQRFSSYWQVLFVGFIASLVTSVDFYLPSRDWLLKSLNISITSPGGIALDKLDSSLIITLGVIILTVISGNDLASLYLKKGNIKKGLTIGGIAFVVSAAGSIPVSRMFFGAGDLQFPKVLSWTPWILIFILGNAFNEELLFRGLFLKKIDPFLGRLCSNLVIAIPFTLHHTGVSYTPDALIFLGFLLPLSLAWGFVTQKTDSLWGSVLFHAGTDIPIVLSIFSNL